MNWIGKRDLEISPDLTGVETAPAAPVRSSAMLGDGMAEAKGARARLRNCWKSVFDPAIALALLVLMAPLLAVLAFMVWRQSGRPILYGQRRWGQGGRLFTCWKFRTMAPDADARLRRLLERDAAARAEWAAFAKLKDDPRVTPVGRLLRRTSLDELPQLWNVLIGDMSLVGARPIAVGEEWRWADQFRYYLLERPGLTGPWQVLYRNSADYRRRLVLHRHYLHHWTPLADLKCLLLTLAVPFVRRNAF